MPRITTHELGYRFERILRKALRGRKNLEAWIAENVPELVEAVPSEAYEEKSPFDVGISFFHGDVTEKSVVALQEDLVSAHLSLKPRVRLTLNLSTVGGDLGAAFALMGTIYDLRRQGREVDIVVRSFALSAGSVITQAGSRRIIESHCIMLLHEPRWPLPELTLRQHEDDLKMAKMLNKSMCDVYASRSKHDAKFYEDLIERRDVYLTAREALAYGLVDEVLRVPTTEKKAA